MAKKDDRVKVRLLPLHSIGGVGGPGDEVRMSKEDADSYVQQGYVELVDKKAEPAVIQSEAVTLEEAEVQPVMKPETRRGKGKK